MNATIDTLARAVVNALGTGILVGAALAILTGIAIRILRPSATTQHALWWIVLTAAVALPVASASVSFGRIEHRVATARVTHAAPARDERTSVNGTGANTVSGASHGSARSVAVDPAQNGARATQGVTPAPSASEWLAIANEAFANTLRYPGIATLLVSLWLAIAALRAGVLVYGFVAILRMKAESVPLDGAVVRKLRRFRHSARTGRPVTILVSREIDVPVAVGFSKPAILLPAAVAEREEIADLDQIVMHEHAHLNRYDDVTNFVQCAFEAFFWFNPVVLLVGRRIALQREIACDDSVIAQTGRAHRYATCLWRLVESARLPSRRVAAPGVLFTPKQITTRIEQLLDSKRNARPRLSPLSALALATLSAALIFTQAVRAPVIALEDPAPPAIPATPPAPAVARLPVAAHPAPFRVPKVPSLATLPKKPLAIPSPAPPDVSALPAAHVDFRHATAIRIASDATPEAIATATIDAAMKRSTIEARRASTLRAAAAKLPADAAGSRSAALAKAAAAMGTGFGLDVARQISEKLAPLSEWPAIERSIARARQSAQREIADAPVADATIAEAERANGGDRRQLAPFRKVRVDGSFDVEVRRGSNPSVEFQGDAFVAAHTRTEVTGDTLVIDQVSGSYSVNRPKAIVVYVPTLESVEIDGSADVRVVDAKARRLSVSISGSGDLVASGSTGAADVTIEGSGNADLANVRATSMNVDIEGSGDVTLAAPDTLAVRIAGSGDVRMRGTPKHVSSEINGSGAIEKI